MFSTLGASIFASTPYQKLGFSISLIPVHPNHFQLAEAQAAKAANTRQRVGYKEDHLVDKTKPLAVLTFAITKPANKTIAEMAAELADKLVASSSSQHIMTSVLAKFAAEHAKSTGLMKSSLFNNPMSKSESLLMSAHTDPPRNNLCQFYMAPEPTIQSASNAQAQYQLISNSAPLQYVHSSGGFVCCHNYGIHPPLPPGPSTGAFPSYMASLLGPLPRQAMQMTMQPGFITGHQQSTFQQQHVLFSHQPPPGCPSGPNPTGGMPYFSNPYRLQ